MDTLEKEEISYILAARKKEMKKEVLICAKRCGEIHPEESSAKDPSHLKVKEVMVDGRNIACLD